MSRLEVVLRVESEEVYEDGSKLPRGSVLGQLSFHVIQVSVVHSIDCSLLKPIELAWITSQKDNLVSTGKPIRLNEEVEKKHVKSCSMKSELNGDPITDRELTQLQKTMNTRNCYRIQPQPRHRLSSSVDPAEYAC